MDKGTYRDNSQEVISMEEYLLRRQRIREAGRKNQQSDVVEIVPPGSWQNFIFNPHT